MGSKPDSTTDSLRRIRIERRRLSRSLDKPFFWLAPVRVLPLMAGSIFLAEICVMVLLYQLPSLPHHTEALLDASILLILLSPTFYFFHYRPLNLHFQARKTAIQQLLKSEERLNLALNAVNDGLWDWDLNNNRLYLSPRGRAILTVSPGTSDFQPEALEGLLHPEDREKATRSLRQHLAGETEHWESEHRLKTPAGEWIWVLARGRVIERNATGQATRAIGTFTDITLRKQAEEQLRQRKEEVRRLSLQLMKSSEEERKQLAHDLHDEFGQVLTSLQLGVEMLREHKINDEEHYQTQCTRLLQLTRRLQSDLRGISDRLRPTMLDDLGLVMTLHTLVKEFAQQSPDLDFRFQTRNMETRLLPEHELILFRICQEALNNCIKHAAASRVEVLLARDADAIRLRIVDNGRGIASGRMRSQPSQHWGSGLIGMRERAAAVHGTIDIRTAAGDGTMIEVRLPISGEGEGGKP